jgi:hypothetical protein
VVRAESNIITGYLPIEPHHHPAILSLVTPATPATKFLDPFAGEGEFLVAAAEAWTRLITGGIEQGVIALPLDKLESNKV